MEFLEEQNMLTFASTLTGLGVHPSTLQHRAQHGRLTRVVRGAYADAPQWQRLDVDRQHLLRVLAAAQSASDDLVFSHYAAAALWGIPILGSWPTTVDVTIERRSGGRSTGNFRRHGTGVDVDDLRNLGGLWVTSPAQTVVDLAKQMPFMHAVAAMDAAAHRKHSPLLTTVDEIRQRALLAEGAKGWKKACAAAEFATSLSDTVWESASRVGIHLLGFPAPTLQQRFFRAGGRYDEVDFWWPEYSAIGEFDGLVKYLSDRFRGNLSPEQVVLKEKLREDRLRRPGRSFARWTTADVRQLSRLAGVLTDAGLPRVR